MLGRRTFASKRDRGFADSPVEGGGFELPVPRADGTQDTALHGANTGSNPVGDAILVYHCKINDL
jgi:hypothetical protein